MTDTSQQNADSQTTPPPLPPPTLLNKTEEDLYAMSHAEAQSDTRRPGLWAKALSESLGDNEKTPAIYIRLRVEQLIAEQNTERNAAIETRRSTPVIFNCPHCGQKLQLTKGALEDTSASRNPSWMRSCSICKKEFDCRTAIPGFDYIKPPPIPPSRVANTNRETPKLTSTTAKYPNNLMIWLPIVIMAVIMSVIAVSVRSCQNRQILNAAEQWRTQNQSNWNR